MVDQASELAEEVAAKKGRFRISESRLRAWLITESVACLPTLAGRYKVSRSRWAGESQ